MDFLAFFFWVCFPQGGTKPVIKKKLEAPDCYGQQVCLGSKICA